MKRTEVNLLFIIKRTLKIKKQSKKERFMKSNWNCKNDIENESDMRFPEIFIFNKDIRKEK